jgi:histidinol-phosphate aminotransferase
VIQPNPVFRSIAPYTPGEQPQDGRTVKLNTNEFPYPAAPEVIRAIREAATDDVRLYPSPRCDRLRERLAEHHRVAPENIFVGNGSDEVLRLVIQLYASPDRMIATVWPSYSLFPNLVAMTGASLHEFPLDDMEKIPASLHKAAWDMLLLPYPNPPLGTLFPESEIDRLASHDGMLVLDEAYADFAAGADHTPLIKRRPNVVISRTFSKSFGLAGLRAGYLIADASIIREMGKIADSYNVNRLTQAAAVAALDALPYYREKVRQICADRDWLRTELIARGFDVPESHANLIFARHPKAHEIFLALKAEGLLVRFFNTGTLSGGVRISIGLRHDLERLLQVVDALLSVKV